MGLVRNDKNIEVRQAVVAEKSNIRAFRVDIAAQSVSVEMEYGNDVEGRFVPVATRTYVIANTPAATASARESVVVAGGRLPVSRTPVANIAVKSLEGQTYFEGVNYRRTGDGLESINIPDGGQVVVTYQYATPASYKFSELADGAADPEKNLYANIKDALWGALLAMGLEAGVVE